MRVYDSTKCPCVEGGEGPGRSLVELLLSGCVAQTPHKTRRGAGFDGESSRNDWKDVQVR